jgi:hypothetical protein
VSQPSIIVTQADVTVRLSCSACDGPVVALKPGAAAIVDGDGLNVAIYDYASGHETLVSGGFGGGLRNLGWSADGGRLYVGWGWRSRRPHLTAPPYSPGWALLR